ncbi:MAG: hypothetical protein FJ098_08705, partial [Deltaproteobacteria bacterium]|nr:hypothetical protein [Deltaproteobacteria bacterium]
MRHHVPLLMLLAALALASACGAGGSAGDGGGDTGPGPDAGGDTGSPDARGPDAGATDLPVEDLPGDGTPRVDTAPDDLNPGELPPGDQVPPPDTTLPDTEDVQAVDTEPPPDWDIRIAAPEADAVVNGAIRIALEPVGTEEWLPDSVSLRAGGQPIFWDRKLPTELVLDTRTLENGKVTLEARASQGGTEVSDTLDVIVLNPQFSFQRVSIGKPFTANGQTVTIFVSAGLPGLTVTADFSALDSAWVAGAEDVYQIGGGKYQVSYTVSQDNSRVDGFYPIPLSLSDGTVIQEYDQLRVKLQNGQEIPLALDGGIFVDEIPPPASQGWTQPISLVYGNDFIITGGSATLNVNFASYAYVEEIIGVLLWVEGYSGYYQLPLEDPDGEVELLVLLRAFIEPETPPDALEVHLAVVDEIGRVSPSVTKALSVESVGSGDIQVSISWDDPSDVDLHVVEPTGCEIYYANDICGSGGWLDLDSNPACSIDWVNNENIFWPLGQAPTGTYIVRVDFYSDCTGEGV